MPEFDNNHERTLTYTPKGVSIMQRIAAITLILALVASIPAAALTVPGTETGHVNVTGSKQIAVVTVEVAYTRTYTTLPRLYANVNAKTGPKVAVQPFEILSQTLEGFTVRLHPQAGKTLKFTWTATVKVYTTK